MGAFAHILFVSLSLSVITHVTEYTYAQSTGYWIITGGSTGRLLTGRKGLTERKGLTGRIRKFPGLLHGTTSGTWPCPLNRAILAYRAL